jgi:hypothetical protein
MVENYTLSQKLKYLMLNVEFVCLLMGLTFIYFISTGI